MSVDQLITDLRELQAPLPLQALRQEVQQAVQMGTWNDLDALEEGIVKIACKYSPRPSRWRHTTRQHMSWLTVLAECGRSSGR